MQFQLVDTSVVNHFMVIVDSEIAVESFEEHLKELSGWAETKKFSPWHYQVCAGSEEAIKHYSEEKPLFLIAYYKVPNVNVSLLVEHFQCPVLLLRPTNHIIPVGSQIGVEILLNSAVCGFLKNPGEEELFMGIMQSYWMTLAVKHLIVANIVVGGIAEGK